MLRNSFEIHKQYQAIIIIVVTHNISIIIKIQNCAILEISINNEI